jgi:hypothetical protein
MVCVAAGSAYLPCRIYNLDDTVWIQIKEHGDLGLD